LIYLLHTKLTFLKDKNDIARRFNLHLPYRKDKNLRGTTYVPAGSGLHLPYRKDENNDDITATHTLIKHLPYRKDENECPWIMYYPLHLSYEIEKALCYPLRI